MMQRTLLPFVVLLIACNVQRSVVIPHQIIESNTTSDKGILFIDMDFRRTKESYQVSISNMKAVDGYLKTKSTEGDLVCVGIRNDGMRDSVWLEQPLEPHYEDYGENGEIKEVRLVLDNASAFVRMPYSRKLTRIEVIDLENNTIKYQCTVE